MHPTLDGFVSDAEMRASIAGSLAKFIELFKPLSRVAVALENEMRREQEHTAASAFFDQVVSQRDQVMSQRDRAENEKLALATRYDNLEEHCTKLAAECDSAKKLLASAEKRADANGRSADSWKNRSDQNAGRAERARDLLRLFQNRDFTAISGSEAISFRDKINKELAT